ncbi:MAG: DUF5665 domain-containing protein [Candidatus Saccharimonadales bacterium]
MKKNSNKVSQAEAFSRRQLFEEMFYDFYQNRHKVYWMNFVRGLSFGFGVLIGGTVVAAAIVWLLGRFVTIPLIGEYIKQIIEVIQK